MSRIWRISAIWMVFCAASVDAQAAGRADGKLELVLVDSQTGEPIAARMSLRNARGRPVRIRQAEVVSSGDHFYFPGTVVLELGRGQYTFDLDSGPEYRSQAGHFEIQRHADDSKRIEMHRFANLAEENWWAADLLAGEVGEPQIVMRAAGIHVLPALVLDKSRQAKVIDEMSEDHRYFGADGVMIYPGLHAFQLDHARSWETPSAGTFRAEVVTGVNTSGGRIVVASMADIWLPVYLATNKIDAVAVISPRLLPLKPPIEHRKLDSQRFSGAQGAGRFAEEVYINILEAGLRVPPVAGSGAPFVENAPLGAARVYVHVEEPLNYQRWWDGLAAGHVFVTNGPLLRPLVRGQHPGHVFYLQEDERIELEIGLNLATREPVDYLEIIKDGQVEFSIRLDEWANRDGRLPPLEFDRSGWFLVRAVTNRQDIHQLAMTGPYYVEKAGQHRISRRAVQFFLDWIDELLGTENAAENRAACEWARDFWQQRFELANAD
jgi:hypothetical protein